MIRTLLQSTLKAEKNDFFAIFYDTRIQKMENANLWELFIAYEMSNKCLRTEFK